MAFAGTIKHPQQNVAVVTTKFKTQDECLWVLLRGDAHHDNPHADHALEKKHLKEVEERNGLWLDVGDLFCAMGGKFDKRMMKAGSVRPENNRDDYFNALVENAAKFYGPHASSCIALADGNHETAVLKKNEIDLIGMLAKSIGVHRSGYGGWVVFNIEVHGRRSSIKLKYFHGSGGGGMMSFDTLRVRRQGSFIPDADVVAVGHVHERWHLGVARERLHLSGMTEIRHDQQHHVRTGTYKDEYRDGSGGWHIERGGPPKPLGAMWMKLTCKREMKQGIVRFELIPEFSFAD